MARINISIPDDLKERMDNASELNWSEIAREAFQTQTAIHELKTKGTDMMAAGIERLRASKQKNAEREEAQGMADGKEWALRRAEYDELERVARLAETVELGVEINASGLGEAIYGDDCDARDITDTLERYFGTAELSDRWCAGFVSGAVEVFNEV